MGFEVPISKVRRARYGYQFWCPACARPHYIVALGEGLAGPVNTIIFPSVVEVFDNIASVNGKLTCSCKIVLGVICYSEDCWHELRGKEAPLMDFPKAVKAYRSLDHGQ